LLIVGFERFQRGVDWSEVSGWVCGGFYGGGLWAKMVFCGNQRYQTASLSPSHQHWMRQDRTSSETFKNTAKER
jgi:hypothetical protein